ncbi:MAG: copper amine oxidase N-terminal domain-containing protein [Firmicutes bacterium]|nr:copper amine oxidase N-terminal domain-containing protein [Bacillota bacterium]
MFKKIIITALMSGILLSGPALPAARAGNPNSLVISVNGKEIVNDAISTFKYGPNGEVVDQLILLPLRKVAEGLGCTVEWDGIRAIVDDGTQKIIVGPGDKVVLVYGKQSASVNELNVATQMTNDHIYIETEFFTRYLGAKLIE